MSIEASDYYPEFELVPTMIDGPDSERGMELIEADFVAKSADREAFVGHKFGISGAYSPADVIQEASANAIAKRGHLRDENVSPWIWEITVNTATSYLRRQTRAFPTDPTDMNGHLAQIAVTENDSQPGQQIELDAMFDTIREYVPNNNVYDTFEMYARDGMRQFEIAAQLGLPQATIKKRIQMVRRTAQRLIDDGILEF